MAAQVLRLKEAVHAWLAAQPKTFFFPEGIKKLVQRWKKCIEKQGDYIEKLLLYIFYFYWNKVCICSVDNYLRSMQVSHSELHIFIIYSDSYLSHILLFHIYFVNSICT